MLVIAHKVRSYRDTLLSQESTPWAMFGNGGMKAIAHGVRYYGVRTKHQLGAWHHLSAIEGTKAEDFGCTYPGKPWHAACNNLTKTNEGQT